MVLTYVETSKPPNCDVILDSSDAGDVVNDTAAAMDIATISYGTAPTVAKASGAITMALPPPIPDI
ncbi:hypothetical protein MGH68_16455 [Erysipelothrix sp. D19-032]